MITGVFRRSSLPLRQSLSTALTSSESCLSHHSNSAATGVSVSSRFALASPPNSFGITARDFNIRSEPSRLVPSGIAFQGYATAREGSRDTIKKSKIRDSVDNVKPLSRKAIALQKEKAEESTSKIKGTKICIAIRSFDNPEKQAWSLPAHTRNVAMPDTRTLYTVLRSPHVDKKSREQFEMRFKKRFLVIKAESHELSKKLFWLKRYRILGAQYELQFHCKTRLDKNHIRDTINASTKVQ